MFGSWPGASGPGDDLQWLDDSDIANAVDWGYGKTLNFELWCLW